MKHLAEFQRCNLVVRLSHLPTLSHQQGGKIRDPGNKVATVGVDQKGPGSIIDILWDIEAPSQGGSELLPHNVSQFDDYKIEVTELFFDFEALFTKIKNVFDRLYCCYGKL